MKGLAEPRRPRGMHFENAKSTSLLESHRHSKWNQMLLYKMELLRKTRVMTATEPEFHSSESTGWKE